MIVAAMNFMISFPAFIFSIIFLALFRKDSRSAVKIFFAFFSAGIYYSVRIIDKYRVAVVLI
ncbi:hypothetical protein DC498_04735 [Terrimonas sp.]|nr:hypothetical protein DC498_04735 [Terrimonas sp.]